MIIHNPLGRWRRPLAAIAALAATLLLGLAGPALPGPQALFGWGGLGLLLAGSVGMLAWHVARLSITPAGRSGQWGAALPASILALATPGIGVAALLAPCALTILSIRRDSEQRFAALAVLSIALAPLAGPLAAAFACATLPALAWISHRGAALVPANDNPSLERIEDIWPLQESQTYANKRLETSESGTWGVA